MLIFTADSERLVASRGSAGDCQVIRICPVIIRYAAVLSAGMPRLPGGVFPPRSVWSAWEGIMAAFATGIQPAEQSRDNGLKTELEL